MIPFEYGEDHCLVIKVEPLVIDHLRYSRHHLVLQKISAPMEGYQDFIFVTLAVQIQKN